MATITKKDIWIKYTEFMIECARDRKKRESFLKGSEAYQREKLEKCGFSIPEGVRICIDTHTQNWPAVFIKVNNTDTTYIVVEGDGHMSVITNFPMLYPKNCELIETTFEKFIEMLGIEAQSSSLAVFMINQLGRGSHVNHYRGIEMKVEIPEPLQDCEVGVRLPFWDPDVDIFSEVRFNHDPETEIVLSCCS